jgi:hypothetical protein
VVEARDAGLLLLVDIDVLDRDRRMSVIVRVSGVEFPSVYTQTMRWQRRQEAGNTVLNSYELNYTA